MASVAVAQHRNQFRSGGKINCRTPRPFHPKSPPKSSRFPSSIPKVPTLFEDFSYSELWAGPAYTNSPPPSSLPIPKFPLRQNRSVSLELPPIDFTVNAASATENLKRILNLDA